jgi:selenoprotein W-related protein
LTEKVAHDYKDAFSRLVLVPSSGGVFEVRVNGKDIHSKKATGQFPETETIVAEVGKLVPSET